MQVLYFNELWVEVINSSHTVKTMVSNEVIMGGCGKERLREKSNKTAKKYRVNKENGKGG